MAGKRKNKNVSNTAVKYRIYPTEEQKAFFTKTFGCCRKIYNLMLEDKIKSYEETKSYGKQSPAMYKDKYPYLREADSLALANAQLNLEKAISDHFRNSKHFGFPVFKSKHKSRKSYTTNNQGGTVAIMEGFIRLPKAGEVKAVIHREPDGGWRLKSATVSCDGDGKYYVSVLFEFERDIKPIEKTDLNAIGLDYKSDGLYMDSGGNRCPCHHKYYRESEKKLKRQQRRLARKKGSRKGEGKSANYLKQLKKVNRTHRKIANQRNDFLHKTSTEIANQYDVVCIEDLDMKALSDKGFGNGKATMDNGNGMFTNMLAYKLADRGKYLVKINKWYPSSQLCSCCGGRQKMELKDRVYECKPCGAVMDRDHNAAVNIKMEGLRILLSA